jgi:hypothetical protein
MSPAPGKNASTGTRIAPRQTTGTAFTEALLLEAWHGMRERIEKRLAEFREAIWPWENQVFSGAVDAGSA